MKNHGLTLLHVRFWHKAIRALIAPFAFALLVIYDPAFIGIIVLLLILALIDRAI